LNSDSAQSQLVGVVEVEENIVGRDSREVDLKIFDGISGSIDVKNSP